MGSLGSVTAASSFMGTNRADRSGRRSCTATVAGGRPLGARAHLTIAIGHGDVSINGVQAASAVSLRQFGVSRFG